MIENNALLIQLPKIVDSRGNLTFVEVNKHIHFEIKRIYYLYGISSGATRGQHGHKKLHQLLIPISGSFEVVLDDGFQKQSYSLDDPSVGLYVPPMMWRELKNFSVGAVCLTLASEYYDESDYFRDYNDFLKSVTKTI